jgi:hypothetical protein
MVGKPRKSVGTYSFTDLLRDPGLRITDRAVDQENSVAQNRQFCWAGRRRVHRTRA